MRQDAGWSPPTPLPGGDGRDKYHATGAEETNLRFRARPDLRRQQSAERLGD